MSWMMLIIAGFCETGFVTFLHKAEGVKNKFSLFLSILFVAVSIFLLSRASLEIPIGVAYGIWAGIGAVGSIVVGQLLFKEKSSLKKYFFVALIIISILGLKLSS